MFGADELAFLGAENLDGSTFFEFALCNELLPVGIERPESYIVFWLDGVLTK